MIKKMSNKSNDSKKEIYQALKEITDNLIKSGKIVIKNAKVVYVEPFKQKE